MICERLFLTLHETVPTVLAGLAIPLSTRHSPSEHFLRWDRLFLKWAIHRSARSFRDRIGLFMSWFAIRMPFSCCAFGMELEGHLISTRANLEGMYCVTFERTGVIRDLGEQTSGWRRW